MMSLDDVSSIFPPRLCGDGSLRKSDSVTLRKEPGSRRARFQIKD